MDEGSIQRQVDALTVGLPLDQVKTKLGAVSKSIEVFNTCKEAFEWPLTSCARGYSAMAIVPLPSAKGTARRDQAQVYLSFDSEQTLTSYSYDLNYESAH